MTADRRHLVAAVLVATALTLSACGGGGTTATSDTTRTPQTASNTSTPTPPHSDSSTNPRPSRTVVTTAGSEVGTVLFDGTGQAIYLFDKETTERPECYASCAEAWPPVLTKGRPAATGAVRPGLLGTTPRNDGTTQVTYAGHPLYFYAHEGKNKVLCHDIEEFGGLWLAVIPSGRPAPH